MKEESEQQDLYPPRATRSTQSYLLVIKEEEQEMKMKEEFIDHQEINLPSDPLMIKKEEAQDTLDPPMDMSTGLKEEPTDHQDINVNESSNVSCWSDSALPPTQGAASDRLKSRKRPRSRRLLTPARALFDLMNEEEGPASSSESGDADWVPDEVEVEVEAEEEDEDMTAVQGAAADRLKSRMWPRSRMQPRSRMRRRSRRLSTPRALFDLMNEEEGPASSSESGGGEEDDTDWVPDEVEVEAEEEDKDSGDAAAPGWRSRSGIEWSPVSDLTHRYLPKAVPRSGITRYATARISELEDTVTFFITEEIIKIIVTMTNLHGHRVDAQWRDTNLVEVKAYIGLLVLAGMFRSRGEATRSLWGEKTGRPLFRATMSHKRFVLLSRTLRFDDWTTRDEDKLAPIRNVWDKWVARLPLAYYPGTDVCVDEQLVAFKGRCSFRQFMPSKPAKYGMKVWALCDVQTSYAWAMQPYLGRARPGAAPEKHLGKRVVTDLTAGLGAGHTVTTDDFFTSYELAMELLRKRKMALVGTVRRNKLELPPKVLSICGRPVLDSRFGFTATATVVSYVPKRGKNVLMLSTKHREEEVSVEAHRKPQIILDYNYCKGAVDNLDKLVGTYSCRRGTRRWPMKMFANMLDVSLYNALVLWLAIEPGWNSNKKYRRRLFLDELGTKLVMPQVALRERLPRGLSAAAMVKEARDSTASLAATTPDKKQCYLCVRKRSRLERQCHKCKQAICKVHSLPVCNTCTK